MQDIAPLRMVNGAMTTAVAIKTDGAQTVDPACVPPVVTDKAGLLAAVQACGLVGVGGAGFPTHVKLAANTIDTLLINAAECEPYLTTDCPRDAGVQRHDHLRHHRCHEVLRDPALHHRH